MQAIVLVGGKGTRLQGLFPDTPKPLVPVAGRPMLERLIEWLGRGGVHDIHLASGYRAESMDRWLAAYHPRNITVTQSIEAEPLGTAGALRSCAEYVRSDPFLALNGDSILPHLDFPELIETHDHGNAQVTLAVAPIRQSGRYGTVEFNSSGLVTAFREKAERAEGWVNGGVYLVARSALDRIQPGRSLSLETDVFPNLVEAQQLRAYRTSPPLLDMGTPEGIHELESFLRAEEDATK